MSHKSQTLAAVIITHNDGHRLPRTLESLSGVDAVYIFDRGSQDDTLALARRATERVYYHPASDAGQILQDALDCVSEDWALVLEPGEWVEDMLRHAIEGSLLNNPQVNGYLVRRRIRFQGQWLERPPLDEPPQLRLVRPGHARVVADAYPALQVNGEVRTIDPLLAAEPYANLQDFFEAAGHRSTQAAYSLLDRDGQSMRTRSMLYLVLACKWRALQAFFMEGGLRGGWLGWSIALARTLETFLTLAKTRALLHKGS